jgi:multidrug efflux system membrane fusion protein
MMERDELYGKNGVQVPARLKQISPRVILIGVVVLAALAFGLYELMGGSSGGGRGGRDGKPAPVRVAVAQLKNVPVTTRTIGTVLANATVEVKSRIDGQIIRAPFREGDIVRAGQLLFQIDPRPWQEVLRQAEAALARDSAQLQSANAIANRTVRLSKIGAASGQERDIAIANARALAGTVAADKAAVQQARLQLGYTRIVAPITGKTGPILVHAGNLVRANDTDALVTITQLQPVKISFALPQSDLPALQDRLRDGTLAATVRARNESGIAVSGETEEFSIKVDFIGNIVSSTTGTVELRATHANPDMRLVPGEQVDVTVRLAVLANVVQVPREAVNVGQNGSYVFVVENGKAVMRGVHVLYQDEHIAALRGAVRAGETVVTDGQLRLTPGARVDIVRGRR